MPLSFLSQVLHCHNTQGLLTLSFLILLIRSFKSYQPVTFKSVNFKINVKDALCLKMLLFPQKKKYMGYKYLSPLIKIHISAFVLCTVLMDKITEKDFVKNLHIV